MGISQIDLPDKDKRKAQNAAQLLPLPEPEWRDKRDQRNSSLITAVTLFAAQEAVRSSQLELESLDKTKCGSIVGSGFHNLYDLEQTYKDFYQNGKNLPTMTIPKNMSSAPATRIAMHFRLRGIISSVSTACSSGFTAIRESFRLIQSGDQECIITGGSDLMVCQSLVRAWERLQVMSRQLDPALSCQPFDQARRGIVLGDGSVCIVLENLENALARGAPILAEIKAIFQNSDSLDLVRPNAKGEIECMSNALNKAKLLPSEIDLIFPHATGTKVNDQIEHDALAGVFGDSLKDKPVCAIKSMIGHTMGASGPMSLAAALGSLSNGYVYPIPNLHHLEEGMELNFSTVGRIKKEVNNILINTFAFGGINVSLVLSRLSSN